MKTRGIVATSCISLLSLSYSVCSDNQNSMLSNQSSVIEPLAIGNYWVFAESSFVNNQHGTIRTEVIGKFMIELEGESVEVFWQESPQLPKANRILRGNDSDGLQTYGIMSEEDTLIAKSLFLKYPAKVGDLWASHIFGRVQNKFFIADTVYYRCVATNQVIKTPAGIFSCYVYERLSEPNTGQNQSQFLIYNALGVGHVGFESFQNGSLAGKQVLLEYLVQ